MSFQTLRKIRPAFLLGTIATGAVAMKVAFKFLIQDVRADSPSAPVKVFGSGLAFFYLPLESAEMVNHNTKRLRFRFADREAISGLPLTSAVLTMAWPKGGYLPTARPYTPITSSDERGHLDLLVKKYPGGWFSTHLHSLKPGDSLFFVASMGGHQWKPNSFPHITLIAGGAGITPIYQLAQGILRNPEDKTAVTVIFGVNNDKDVLLQKELKEYEHSFPGRFKVVYVVSNPDEGSPYRSGHVTKELLEEVTPLPKGRETMAFISGPPPMEAALVGNRKTPGILQQLGYRKDQIHTF